MVVAVAFAQTESTVGDGKENIIINNIVVNNAINIIDNNNGFSELKKLSGRSRNIGAILMLSPRSKLRNTMTSRTILKTATMAMTVMMNVDTRYMNPPLSC